MQPGGHRFDPGQLHQEIQERFGMTTELRVVFGGVSLFCFVVSLFGRRVDFRWAHWRFKPMVSNSVGRVYFAAFGVVFGLVAAFAR